jgi:hypothetical protein
MTTTILNQPGMKIMLRIALFVILGLILLTVFLNPNASSFKNYAHDLGDYPTTIYKREANYFIFSIYLKQTPDYTKKYYGFAGNFFLKEDNEGRASITVPGKPASIDPPVILGPNAHIWMDSVCAYLNKRPQASDSVVFKKFPQLRNDSRIFNVVLAYCYGKSKGMSDEEEKKLFPEAYK